MHVDGLASSGVQASSQSLHEWNGHRGRCCRRFRVFLSSTAHQLCCSTAEQLGNLVLGGSFSLPQRPKAPKSPHIVSAVGLSGRWSRERNWSHCPSTGCNWIQARRPSIHTVYLVRVLRTIGPSPDAELVPEDVHLFVRVHSSSPHQRIVVLAQAVVLAL